MATKDFMTNELTVLRSRLEEDGFVRIPKAIDHGTIISLRAACSHITQDARSGKWPYIRTIPKQFPPWKAEDYKLGIWGVQHLLHPDIAAASLGDSSGPVQRMLAKSYFSDLIIDAAKDILGCGEEDLVMELYNLLVKPDRDFELRWHRDDIPPSATDDEERSRLSEPAWHAQWNLALYDDRSLIVVPASHKRPRTEAERAADPYKKFLPDMKIVEMRAGDLVFYDNNILHRGVYDASVKRMTLHGSIGHIKGSRQRARNVLQHGVGSWIERCKFDQLQEPLKRRADGMRRRLLEMAGASAADVGYSQPD